MELYMQNKEHRRIILELVENIPLIWHTIEENGVTRTKKYPKLSVAEKIEADYAMKATKNILQGLLAIICSHVNHHRVTKDLWERVQLLMQGDDLISCLNKAMAFPIAVASSRFPLTNNQLRTSSNPRNQATIQDGRVTVQQVQGRQGQSYSGTGYKSNANSSRENNANKQARVVKCYNCQVVKKMIDSQMDDMIKDKHALKEQVDSLEQNLSNQIKEKECLLQTFTVFKSESKAKKDKYMENKIDFEKKIKELDNFIFTVGQSAHTYDGIVISNKHVAMPVIDDEETLILEEKSRSKMSTKENDPKAIKRKISNKPIDYVKLNKLYEDFGKRFVLQQELSTDEAFWYHMLNPSTKSFDALHVKIEVLKELPKVILVNESLKKLKLHLANFDKVVKIRTTPNARTEGKWGFEHTKPVFNNKTIPYLNSLKDIFNVFDKDLLNEVIEVQSVFDQMDIAV
nr:hypothetical protein [Tanacetum cinerariifolium]